MRRAWGGRRDGWREQRPTTGCGQLTNRLWKPRKGDLAMEEVSSAGWSIGGMG